MGFKGVRGLWRVLICRREFFKFVVVKGRGVSNAVWGVGSRDLDGEGVEI